MKISRDEYFLRLARAAARGSTCLHRQYGAVLVRDDIVVAMGSNGAAEGEVSCCDNGECWRETHDTQQCKAVHAEMNAIANAARLGISVVGTTLYLAGFENGKPLRNIIPCDICLRVIRNAGIERIITNWFRMDDVPPIPRKYGKSLIAALENDDTSEGDTAGSPPADA